jgi:hypothetical protein
MRVLITGNSDYIGATLTKYIKLKKNNFNTLNLIILKKLNKLLDEKNLIIF